MKDILLRLYSGIGITVGTIFLLQFSQASYFLFLIIVAFFCSYEFIKKIHKEFLPWHILLSRIAILICPIIVFFILKIFNKIGVQLFLNLSFILCLLYFLFEIKNFGKTKIQVDNKINDYITGVLYIGFPCLLGFGISDYDMDQNYKILLGVFILIWSNDTFAYLSGRILGKTPLAPLISPNKTVEGFLGGVILSIPIATIVSIFFKVHTLIEWVIISILISIFGTLGDLIESKFKRSWNIKDSGNFFPGHGGFLDRYDSFLIVSPIIFLFEKLTH